MNIGDETRFDVVTAVHLDPYMESPDELQVPHLNALLLLNAALFLGIFLCKGTQKTLG